MPTDPRVGGGTDLVFDFQWKALYLRSGAGAVSQLLPTDDGALQRLGLGGQVGAGLSIWGIQLMARYDVREGNASAPGRSDAFLISLHIDPFFARSPLVAPGRGTGRPGPLLDWILPQH